MLIGKSGNDVLEGGNGSDRLWGGAGKDTFVFKAVSDSHNKAMDIIKDFHSGEGDVIDLSSIDAIQNSAGFNDTFVFVGKGKPVAVGELAYHQLAGDAVLVRADTTGDGIVDFAIKIEGVTSLQAGDFIL